MVPKTRARKEALALRRKMSPEERSFASEAVARGLLNLELIRPGETVCFYMATPEEVETRALVTKALEVGCTVVLPKVVGNDHMELYQVEDLRSQVVLGSFGIEEPLVESAAPVPPESVDLFVVPVVAFDLTGRRCGSGRGYFDRVLTRRASGSLVIALAFECQLQPSLPAEDHDVPMDFICTDKRIIHCRGQSVGRR